MNAELRYRGNGFSAILHWVRKQIVDEVPPDLAVCEFDCEKTQCTLQQWKTCPRRFRKEVGSS